MHYIENFGGKCLLGKNNANNTNKKIYNAKYFNAPENRLFFFFYVKYGFDFWVNCELDVFS